MWQPKKHVQEKSGTVGSRVSFTIVCLTKIAAFSLIHRYTSSVHYDSDRHFIQNVSLEPWGQSLEHCRQTIMAVSNSTWRHYVTQLEFQPRHRPKQFKSTTIIYPKKASTIYTTELSYNCHRLSRRFLSSVELDAVANRKLPQWEWTHGGRWPGTCCHSLGP